MSMTYGDALGAMEKQGQAHVFRFWDRLDAEQRAALLAQVEALDVAELARMRECLSARAQSPAAAGIEPAPVVTLAGAEREAARKAGEDQLRSGAVGVLLVAGGQGSRLGFDGPKGAFPIGPITGATLFQIHARKILALERRHRHPIPFYIMTSRDNDRVTRSFFRQHGFFGLAEERVCFFRQGMWPAVAADGRLIMDRPDHIFMSPDGHGGVLAALRVNRVLDDMRKRGVRHVFYFQVDNPLVEVADPVFVGAHHQRQADMSVKVCAKRDAEEGLGVVVTRDGATSIVEYTELTREQKHATGRDGLLRFRFGSVAIHVFSVEFLASQAEKPMPLHVAHKKVPCCDDSGRQVSPQQPNAYKFEKFIFDVLPAARRALCLEFAREDEFSPVKNASGTDSPDSAKADQVLKYARLLERAGVRVPRNASGAPRFSIEIDPCYALDAEELRKRLSPAPDIRGDLLLN